MSWSRAVCAMVLAAGSVLPVAAQEAERLFVVGNPLGLGWTVTEGIVSAVGREAEGRSYLQMQAPISPGSSGSPVFTYEGLVVGVATFHAAQGQSLNFAVRVERVKELLAKEGPVRKLADLFPPPPPPSPSPASPSPPAAPRQQAAPCPGERPKPGEMVLIPEGEFLRGSPEGEGDSDEHPQRRIFLNAFLIEKTEVTWGQYREFCQETGRALAAAPSRGIQDDHPVVNVTWDDARAYCEWAGRRLPTEAEWEKAARGTDGRKYPWGTPDAGGRYRANHDPGSYAEDGFRHTAPVGSFSQGASPYGVLDMAGNVWEWCADWCADWYDESYYASAPARDPKGPASGQYRVHRGGSWLNYDWLVRAANRLWNDPTDRHANFGFRCAQDPPR